MVSEETPNRKTSRVPLFQLMQERERCGWTQSEVAKQIGTTQVNVSRWEQGITFPSAYYRRKLGTLFGKTLSELGLVPENEDDNDEQILASPHPQTQMIWNLPYRRNPFFTGREEILAHLHSVLTDNQTAALTQAQAISGLGGIGKTQIAVEYAYRYCNSYTAILWITASSRDTLITDFVMLANVLDLPEQYEQDKDIVLRAVTRWLTTHTNWLLIVDNVDDLKMVLDLLPTRGTGKVLLTTRLQALGSLAQNIEVENMEREEGILFLLRRTKVLVPHASLDRLTQEGQDLAANIVASLEGLPLALDQAGAYIEETRCGFLEYLNLFGTRRKELLEKRSIGILPIDHPESVTATWSLSFQQIEEINPAAADLLRLFAFLDAEAIPEEILSAGAAELGPALEPVARDPLKLNIAISTLLRYSLIRRNSKVLSIHRLVQAVLKDGMEQDLQRTWAERAIRATNRAFPNVELITWNQCRQCLPHAQISAAYIEEYGLAFPEAARLLNQAANYLSTHAEYEQAESLLKKALAIRQQVLESFHPDTAITLNDLGALYLAQGKYQHAEPLLLQARAICEQTLGSESPNTATSLHNLATLYYAQGKYSLAEYFYKKALDIRQSVLEPDHLDIAQNLNDLAELYTVQGNYTQAESLYLQARDSQEKALGLDHPDVAKTLNNLALLYRSKGAYTHAEQFYQQALSIQEQVLGSNHPDVAQTLNNLARLYRAQGEYVKAEPFYLRALRIRETTLGPDHPHLAQSFYSLAKLYHSQGKYAQAQELCQQALSIQERRLGTNHPTIASTLGILARIYQEQDLYTQAEELYQRALTIRESTSGSDHPHVAFIINSLAEIYQTQGKYSEARLLIARSLAIREQSLGRDHPYIAYSLSNLADNSFLQGDYAQAESLFKEALAIREKTLGLEHPNVATSLEHLAHLLHKTERAAEAYKLEERARTIRTKVSQT